MQSPLQFELVLCWLCVPQPLPRTDSGCVGGRKGFGAGGAQGCTPGFICCTQGVGAGPAALCPALLGGSRVPGGGHSYLWVLGASTPNTQPEMGPPTHRLQAMRPPRGSWPQPGTPSVPSKAAARGLSWGRGGPGPLPLCSPSRSADILPSLPHGAPETKAISTAFISKHEIKLTGGKRRECTLLKSTKLCCHGNGRRSPVADALLGLGGRLYQLRCFLIYQSFFFFYFFFLCSPQPPPF